MREEFGKKAHAVAFDDPRRFHAGFVIREPFFGREPSHADINAGKFGFARGVQIFDFAMPRRRGIKENDINIVMMGRFSGRAGAKLTEGAAFETGFVLRDDGH